MKYKRKTHPAVYLEKYNAVKENISHYTQQGLGVQRFFKDAYLKPWSHLAEYFSDCSRQR